MANVESRDDRADISIIGIGVVGDPLAVVLPWSQGIRMPRWVTDGHVTSTCASPWMRPAGQGPPDGQEESTEQLFQHNYNNPPESIPLVR